VVQIHSPRPFFSTTYARFLVFPLHRCRRFCRRFDSFQQENHTSENDLVSVILWPAACLLLRKINMNPISDSNDPITCLIRYSSLRDENSLNI
jgi:hypothetical protein